MAKNEDDVPILISEDDARGGVTGHHVRYVLTFGLAGIIIAFIAIAAYFDYGALTQAISKVFAAVGFRQRLLFYAVPLALAPVAVVLLLGLWDTVWGRSATAHACSWTCENSSPWCRAQQRAALPKTPRRPMALAGREERADQAQRPRPAFMLHLRRKSSAK